MGAASSDGEISSKLSFFSMKNKCQNVFHVTLLNTCVMRFLIYWRAELKN